MRLVSLISTVIIIIAFACREGQSPDRTFEEPADPEGLETADWAEVSENLNSGFGDTNVRYSRSKPPGGDISSELSLTGWKGEKVHGQLLFWSASDQGKIIVTGEKSEGGVFVPDSTIIIRTVKYVLSDEFMTGCGYRDKDTIASFLMPDVLDNTNTFILPGMQTRPVWISIPIPAETRPGNYNFRLQCSSALDTVYHTLKLEVQEKMLAPPSEWSFHLDLWQNPFAVARYHKVKLWSQEHMDLLKPLLTMLAGAGQKCITTTISNQPWGGQTYDPYETMITWIKNSEGFWDYDYSVFDQYVELAISCGIDEQINCFSMVPWGNEYRWFDQDSGKFVSANAIPGSEEYINIWKPFLDDFRVHLMEMGWLGKTAIALDERNHEEMTNMIAFLREAAPDFKIAMAGHFFEDLSRDIYDFSYNWQDISGDTKGHIQKREEKGQITTYYVACSIPEPNTFTFSPPAQSAYLGWLSAAMGFDGFLRWAYNSWPENPLYDSRFITWPSGDTYMVYPGARSSVRFEKLIDGIQDYEKIRLLRKELALNPSMEAAEAELRISEFLDKINTASPDSLPAHEIIKTGRQMLNEISRIK